MSVISLQLDVLFKACYPYSCHIISAILTSMQIKPSHPYKDANQIQSSKQGWQSISLSSFTLLILFFLYFQHKEFEYAFIGFTVT